MPKLEMMMLVLLILPLSYFDAGGQAVQGYDAGMDRYLLPRKLPRILYCAKKVDQNSGWVRCCTTLKCGKNCCPKGWGCIRGADPNDAQCSQ
uniref:Conotoxin n=1 Tax=Conus praecellens TaxID=128530 RepID=A0A291C294_CONPC|nr:conotoxin [Conus praecellens]ATF27589.1 conotoxin [Conus praecellens]